MILQPDTAIATQGQLEARIPDLSVVIVSWNAKEFVNECLKSLIGQYSYGSVEVIVVDNASSDGTPELVREQFPEVKLLRNPQNLGFAKANNMGVSVSRGKYICLVNSDVTMRDGCLRKMFQYMEQNPSIGMLGPAMLGADGRVRRSCMRIPTLWNSLCYALGLDLVLKGFQTFSGFLMRDFQHDEIRDVEVLNGWFWMVRRQALAEVGGLDERFFMYSEDIDWCKRFHSAGWRVVFYPDAQAVHYGGASSASLPLHFHLELQHARLQYWEKHHGRTSRRLYVFILLLEQLVRLVGHASQFVRKSARPQSAFKLERSIASLRWLLGMSADR